jgi:hypothetical protein
MRRVQLPRTDNRTLCNKVKRIPWNAIVNSRELTQGRIWLKVKVMIFRWTLMRYGIPGVRTEPSLSNLHLTNREGDKERDRIAYLVNIGITKLLQMPLSYSATFITTCRRACAAVLNDLNRCNSIRAVYTSESSPTHLFINSVLFKWPQLWITTQSNGRSRKYSGD